MQVGSTGSDRLIAPGREDVCLEKCRVQRVAREIESLASDAVSVGREGSSPGPGDAQAEALDCSGMLAVVGDAMRLAIARRRCLARYLVI